MLKSKHLIIFKLFITPLISTLLISSCTSLKKEAQRPAEKLFPDGIYSQSINLEIRMKNNKKSTFPFRSVSRIKNQNFELLGLTPFGTKAFEAKGNMEDPDSIIINFFMEKPPLLKDDFIKKILNSIQKIQSLKKSELVRKKGYDILKIDEFLLQIFSYSHQNIPETLRVKTSQWKADIKLISYKSH